MFKNLLQRRFVQDVLTLQAGSVFAHGLSFLKSVIFARLLGLEGFGIYAVVLAFTGTLNIITNFGQGQASLTFFAEKYSQKNTAGMKGVLRYYISLSLISATILILFAMAAPTVTDVLYSNPEIGTATRIAFLALLAGSFDTLFTNTLQSVREVRKLTILENINIVLQVILSTLFLILGFGIPGIFLGTLISNLLMLCVYIAVYRQLQSNYPIPGIREALKSKEPIKPYLTQGLWIAVDKNVGNLFPRSFIFIMSLFTNASVVGIAQLAFKIGTLPKMLILPHVGRMGMSVLPTLKAGDVNTLRRTCAQLIKHSLAFHALASFAALLVLPPLTILFYGWEFGAAVPPMLWIILISIITALNVANSPLFRMLEKAHIPAIWGIAEMGIGITLFMWFLRIFEPLNAFVLIILIMTLIKLWLNMYLYRLLSKGKAAQT